MSRIEYAALVSAILFLAGPLAAKELTYTAALRGDTAPTITGSKATATAKITVDTVTKTVDVNIDVTGITIDGLWDNLVAAPVGPIHLHHYQHKDHSNGDGVTLILPVPFGPSYTATPTGFSVTVADYPYTSGATLLQSDKTFDTFVSSLNGGDIVLNIHTDKFTDGEISGLVVPAK